jgi:hypothetical protein
VWLTTRRIRREILQDAIQEVHPERSSVLHFNPTPINKTEIRFDAMEDAL